MRLLYLYYWTTKSVKTSNKICIPMKEAAAHALKSTVRTLKILHMKLNKNNVFLYVFLSTV